MFPKLTIGILESHQNNMAVYDIHLASLLLVQSKEMDSKNEALGVLFRNLGVFSFVSLALFSSRSRKLHASVCFALVSNLPAVYDWVAVGTLCKT